MSNQTQCKAIASLSDAVAFSTLAPRTVPVDILMCPPTYFEVRDSKNEFMAGQIGNVDKENAKKQWHDLKATFEKCGHQVKLIDARQEHEDMVFTANQVLTDLDADGRKVVILSHMTHQSRQGEIRYFREWFEDQGYVIYELPSHCGRIEGHGDAIWHPGRQMLWIGYGHRTEESSCDVVAKMLNVPVVKLKLVTSKFYHLDTAFAALSEEAVLIYPGAFDRIGLELINHYFQYVIEASEADANNFACNAVALEDKVILQKGSTETCASLTKHGFKHIEVDTSEFMKSGGSAFCLKQMVY